MTLRTTLTTVALLVVATATSTAMAQQPAPPSYGPQQAPEPGFADDDPTALTAFRSTLDPWGYWIEDPTYGLLWVPNATAMSPYFTPYVTAGRWTYGASGWTWVSDYPWGWVAFHYGRWTHVPGVGWAWIPGRRYAGAWVSWRAGDALVGWAPAPPERIWRDGAAVPVSVGFAPPEYTFVSRDRLFSRYPDRYVRRGREYEQRTAPAHADPPPNVLGIAPERVVTPPASHPGLRAAALYARPGTAPRANASPPRPTRRAR